MNRAAFFHAIRRDPFARPLSQRQVNGIVAIMNEWDRRGLSDLRHLAYMLATTFHETARTMEPIAEYGHGKGHSYGALSKNGQSPYGRGFVQLTWDYNYERADKELGLNGALTANYELALRPDIAAQILFGGMLGGWFTDRKLADYFHDGVADWINARRIINGTDKAATIAGYGKAFYAALTAAHDATAPASPAAEPPPKPPADWPPIPPRTLEPVGFWRRFFLAILRALKGS